MQPSEELVGKERYGDWIVAGEKKGGGGGTDTFQLAKCGDGFARIWVVFHQREGRGGRLSDFLDGIGGDELGETRTVGAKFAVSSRFDVSAG